MDMNRFYVENGKVALNTYEIVVRQYSDLEKNEYFDTPRYVNDKEAYELEVNYVPKHRLLEIVSKQHSTTLNILGWKVLNCEQPIHKKKLRT